MPYVDDWVNWLGWPVTVLGSASPAGGECDADAPARRPIGFVAVAPTRDERPDRELCPMCGAACTDRGCKLVCDRCRVVVRNCSE